MRRRIGKNDPQKDGEDAPDNDKNVEDEDLSSGDSDEDSFNSAEDPSEIDMYSTASKERRRKKVRARLPLRKRLGATLESSDIQVVIVTLIVLDIVIALVRLFTSFGGIPYLSKAESFNKFLEYGNVFITMVFILELFFALIAFHYKTFSHPGYVLDYVVVGTQVYLSLSTGSLAIRVLGVARFWRVVRLLRDSVAQIEESHQETLQLLEEQRDRNDDLVAQLRGKNDELRRELDRRNRVQEMLKSYKEEVETLQEALFIAAQTTASDAASLLPPETIDSYTSQYSTKSSKARGGYEAYGTTQNASSVRPTNLIVAEDGTVRRAQKT